MARCNILSSCMNSNGLAMVRADDTVFVLVLVQ
jgi:hypothetical protein